MDKFDVLRKYFGYSSFRKGQEEMVDCLLSGRDVLGIMPTGAGKSICYQVSGNAYGIVQGHIVQASLYAIRFLQLCLAVLLLLFLR